MIPADARFIEHVRLTLRHASLERLYYLAQQIHFDLARRELPARCEAAALELALLTEAQRVRALLRETDALLRGPAKSDRPS